MRPADPSFFGGVTGVLLVGGRSRRMGADKARLTLRGESFLAILGARLFGLFGRLRVVGGPCEIRPAEAGVAARDAGAFAWVPDRWPDGGPLGGLCSGLAAVDTPEAFAAACDMPLLDPVVVRAIYPAGGLRSDACVLRAAGRTHPLHAFYRVAALPRLERIFHRGARSLHEALAAIDVVESTIPEALVAAAERSCANVNTPAEFERLRNSARE